MRISIETATPRLSGHSHEYRYDSSSNVASPVTVILEVTIQGHTTLIKWRIKIAEKLDSKRYSHSTFTKNSARDVHAAANLNVAHMTHFSEQRLHRTARHCQNGHKPTAWAHQTRAGIPLRTYSTLRKRSESLGDRRASSSDSTFHERPARLRVGRATVPSCPAGRPPVADICRSTVCSRGGSVRPSAGRPGSSTAGRCILASPS